MWAAEAPIRINGIRKWKEKKRFKVALSTANPPQIHSTRV
jgi:hypothetical protein